MAHYVRGLLKNRSIIQVCRLGVTGIDFIVQVHAECALERRIRVPKQVCEQASKLGSCMRNRCMVVTQPRSVLGKAKLAIKLPSTYFYGLQILNFDHCYSALAII